jgi:hypothetical protein
MPDNSLLRLLAQRLMDDMMQRGQNVGTVDNIPRLPDAPKMSVGAINQPQPMVSPEGSGPTIGAATGREIPLDLPRIMALWPLLENDRRLRDLRNAMAENSRYRPENVVKRELRGY